MTDTVNMIVDIVILTYLLPLSLFVCLYTTRSPWRSTELGVALLFQKLGFLAVVIVIIASLFFGAYPGREFVRLAVYATVNYFLWLDVINLLRYQSRPYSAKFLASEETIQVKRKTK